MLDLRAEVTTQSSIYENRLLKNDALGRLIVSVSGVQERIKPI
ncbi:hypothetical protein [Aliiglaciecola sp. M165]|nr:hypothetical protein [Aliiglaciecola sp. M165]